ncbi:MAG: 30S ribosome-binding factor RbfA [Clostridia bacterium]
MHRLERLSEDMQLLISKIVQQELKNPDIDGIISITKVDITPDQKYAKVHTSIYGANNKDAVLAALKKSAGFVRKQMSQRLKLRNAPELTFVMDESIEYGAHINEVLKNI